MVKKLLLIFLLYSCGHYSMGQARLVLNNGAFVHIDNGAKIVIQNPTANAITTLGTGGNIVSEGEFNQVAWHVGTSTGTYTIPFTTSGGTRIPFSMQVNSAGAGSGTVTFSTYNGPDWNNDNYRPSDVTHTSDLATGSVNNSAYAIDRFWIADATGYTTRPQVTLNFTYVDAEWSAAGNSISESGLFAQRFNSTLSKWGDWLGQTGTANVAGNTVSSGPVASADFFRSWTLSDQSIPLPVELLTFKGICEDGSAKLEWITLSEVNSKAFEIQFSPGDGKFSTIQTVEAAGFSSTPKTYSATVKLFKAANHYFRLKQVDLDNSFRFTETIHVDDCSAQDAFSVTLHEGFMTVKLEAGGQGRSWYRVFDVTGRIVFEQEIAFAKGSNVYMFPLRAATGVYFYQLSEGGNSLFSGKLMHRTN